MPLHVKVESYDRPEIIFASPLPVESGMVRAWEDRSHGMSRYVVARCLVPDMGAQIFTVEEVYHSNNGIIVLNFAEDAPDDVVLPGLSLPLDIVDVDDEHMRMTFQHVMPNGTINSLS